METITIISNFDGPLELLQRGIGGLVKGLAIVSVCHPDELDSTDSRLFISYRRGDSFRAMQQRMKARDRRVIGAELTLLPVGV